MFTNLQGQRFLLEEVSVQQWHNKLIIRERFYYQSTQLLAD